MVNLKFKTKDKVIRVISARKAKRQKTETL